MFLCSHFSALDKDLQLVQTQLSSKPQEAADLEPDVCVINDDQALTVRVLIRGVIHKHMLALVV